MRLIDADKLIRIYFDDDDGNRTFEFVTDAELEHTNTIEFTTPSQKKIMFQKVKYGKWIATGFMAIKCNICGATQYELVSTNYCPNCGAKMEEKIVLNEDNERRTE